jgi:multidrug efflux pump subunit AcrA (membrane-fusion protein)
VAEEGLFRQEALKASEEAASGSGDMLHLSPRWLRSTYWILCAAAAGMLSFASFATVGEYASGPAVVRVEGRVDLSAPASGIVQEVRVQPGQHVRKGQLLVRFNVAGESAELQRLQSEFDDQLVKLLRDPNDSASRQALTTLRAQRDLAAAHVAQRAVRAPQDGIVSDVRIRPSQLLQAGDVVLSLLGEGTRFVVVAFLPGQYRPLLRPAMALRLRLKGFDRGTELMTIDSVGDEVVGPAEARRYLGPDVADAVTVNGPVVLVKAHLAAPTFVSDGKRFNFYDGMTGDGEVRVRARRVLIALVPGLGDVVGDGG